MEKWNRGWRGGGEGCSGTAMKWKHLAQCLTLRSGNSSYYIHGSQSHSGPTRMLSNTSKLGSPPFFLASNRTPFCPWSWHLCLVLSDSYMLIQFPTVVLFLKFGPLIELGFSDHIQSMSHLFNIQHYSWESRGKIWVGENQIVSIHEEQVWGLQLVLRPTRTAASLQVGRKCDLTISFRWTSPWTFDFWHQKV